MTMNAVCVDHVLHPGIQRHINGQSGEIQILTYCEVELLLMLQGCLSVLFRCARAFCLFFLNFLN